MTSQKPPALPPPSPNSTDQGNPDTPAGESSGMPEDSGRHDRSNDLRRGLRRTRAPANVAARSAARHDMPSAKSGLAGALISAGTATEATRAKIPDARFALTGISRPKPAHVKAKPQKPNNNQDRSTGGNLAQIDRWETDTSEFSLAGNRVIGFMVGLVASMLVAWFAITLVEQPGTITQPIIVTQQDNRVANEESRFKPTPSRTDTSDKIRSPSAGMRRAAKHAPNTQTNSVSPNRRGLSGFASRSLASNAKKISADRGTARTEANSVNRPVGASPLSLQPEERPPMPRRNSLRQASQASAIIDLPERRPTRKPPPPGTFKARATKPFGHDSRMGLGLYNLMIERPPPVQRPAPANSRQ